MGCLAIYCKILTNNSILEKLLKQEDAIEVNTADGPRTASSRWSTNMGDGVASARQHALPAVLL
jgi:hypothetical protein